MASFDPSSTSDASRTADPQPQALPTMAAAYEFFPAKPHSHPTTRIITRFVQPITHAMRVATLDALTRNLSLSGWMTLTVGKPEEETSFRVREDMLASISETFKDMMEAKKIRRGEDSVLLILPDDNVSAWKVLLYLLMSRGLPPMFFKGKCAEPDLDDLVELLVESWILGDRYKFVEFQDLIMAELLQILAGREVMAKGVIAAALHADPESKIYELMANAMADRLEAHGHSNPTVTSCLNYDDIPQHFVDKVQGIDIAAVPWAADLYNSKPACMHYMMDGGPRTHWLYVFGPFYSSHDDSDNDDTGSEEGSEEGSGDQSEAVESADEDLPERRSSTVERH